MCTFTVEFSYKTFISHPHQYRINVSLPEDRSGSMDPRKRDDAVLHFHVGSTLNWKQRSTTGIRCLNVTNHVWFISLVVDMFFPGAGRIGQMDAALSHADKPSPGPRG